MMDLDGKNHYNMETMKILFNLELFGIKKQKKFLFNDDELSFSILQSILSHIANCYMYSKYENVEIPAYQFQKIITNYKPYLKYLEDKGIILINNHYEVGKESRKYYFTDLFKESALIIDVKPDTDKLEEEYDKKCIIEKPILKKLKQDYKSIKVINKVNKKFLFWKDGVHISDFKNYISNYLHITHLDNMLGHFKTSNNRLYSNFVQLSSDVKITNVKLNNNNITGFDIKSSFPLFFALWMLENGIDYSSEDLIEYCLGINKGKFYHNLTIKLNKVKDLNHISKDNLEQKESPSYYVKSNNPEQSSKVAFQVWLNSININSDGTIKLNPNSSDFNKMLTDMNAVMSSYFPEITELFIKNKLSKNTFSNILEEMEADFIYNKIIKRCYDEITNIKILTCHDSIYFEEKFLDDVAIIWDDELNKLYDKLPIEDDVDENNFSLGEIFEIG